MAVSFSLHFCKSKKKKRGFALQEMIYCILNADKRKQYDLTNDKTFYIFDTQAG